MSAAGSLAPSTRYFTRAVSSHSVILVRILSEHFSLGATLALNNRASIVLLTIWWLAKFSPPSSSLATDPVCGMSVDTASAAAIAERDGVIYHLLLTSLSRLLSRGKPRRAGRDTAQQPF